MFRREFLRRVGMAALAAGFLRVNPIEWGADWADGETLTGHVMVEMNSDGDGWRVLGPAERCEDGQYRVSIPGEFAGGTRLEFRARVGYS